MFRHNALVSLGGDKHTCSRRVLHELRWEPLLTRAACKRPTRCAEPDADTIRMIRFATLRPRTGRVCRTLHLVRAVMANHAVSWDRPATLGVCSSASFRVLAVSIASLTAVRARRQPEQLDYHTRPSAATDTVDEK